MPVVNIRKEQTDKNDRIASTIRHNRARGKHQVNAMSEIVIELKNRNWIAFGSWRIAAFGDARGQGTTNIYENLTSAITNFLNGCNGYTVDGAYITRAVFNLTNGYRDWETIVWLTLLT